MDLKSLPRNLSMALSSQGLFTGIKMYLACTDFSV